MTGDTLQDRWRIVTARVEEACRQAGRDPGEVSVLPVSKTVGSERIREAIDALGLRRFGENKAQEIRDKAQALGSAHADTTSDAQPAIDWVMIGHLQTNKAAVAARLAAEVQSLDRPELAAALDRHLRAEGRQIDVLVQVKTSQEPGKYGLAPADLPAFLEELVTNYPRLRVQGLMTMAVNSGDAAAVRDCFRRLRLLREAAAAQGHDLPRLSMGMSGDFPLAIAEGATEVRIGTALFGPRAYPAAD